MTTDIGTLDRDLTHLEAVWETGMKDAYHFYRARAEPPVALAAALVEAAADLQGLGGPAADPGRLLLGDLCLARASRLLAGTCDHRLQVGIARAIERLSAAAAGGHPTAPLRDELVAVVRGRP